MNNGLPADDKSRKALPLWSFLMEYFPDAFVEVCKVAVVGNNQHNPGQPLHWAREKSTDQMNTAFRHLFDYGRGTRVDVDGVLHLAKAIWRLSAQLQLDVEAARDPVAKLAAPATRECRPIAVPADGDEVAERPPIGGIVRDGGMKW